jgi:hypothetical protein
MALWGFGAEGSQVASGANTVAGIIRGFRPLPQSGGLGHSFDTEGGGYANKRNVIATNKGWVRRINKRDTHGNQRQFDEVLVAANPGLGLGTGWSYTSNTYLGRPDIAEIYVKLNANNVISANVSANLYVVFNMPVHLRSSSNGLTILIANTVGGNHGIARITASAAARANVANNVMVFTMPKLQGGTGSAKATYHINAQSIGVTGGGNPLYNPEAGANPTRHAANLVITGATANALARFNGERIINFTVSPKGV